MKTMTRKRLLEKVKRKEQEIQEYEARIGKTRACLQKLQDSIKLLQKTNKTNGFNYEDMDECID